MILTESKVRYAATTPSSLPSLHSWMNSVRLVAVGSTSSAISLRDCHVLCALYHWSGLLDIHILRWLYSIKWGLTVLDDLSQEQNLGFSIG